MLQLFYDKNIMFVREESYQENSHPENSHLEYFHPCF